MGLMGQQKTQPGIALPKLENVVSFADCIRRWRFPLFRTEYFMFCICINSTSMWITIKPFYNMPFHNMPFHNTLFHNMLFHNILFYNMPLYNKLFYNMPFHNMPISQHAI